MAGFLDNLNANLVGNIQKAIIWIVDAREPDPEREKAVKAQGGNGFFDSKLISSNILGEAMAAVGAKDLTSFLSKTKMRKFEVQFNPSELRLSGIGGGRVQKMNYGGNDPNELTYESMNTRITLDVNLIFDKVNPKDAFMFDKMTLSETSVATGIAQGILKALGKLSYSVQPEVEGFIAAISNERTRQIFFDWGTMHYTGVLNNISSSYTMFNQNGEPIRGNVRLSLVSADDSVKVGSRTDPWAKAYMEAFGDNDISFTKAAQKVGNLLNFNL